MYDNGGKVIVCDPTCVGGDISHCDCECWYCVTPHRFADVSIIIVSSPSRCCCELYEGSRISCLSAQGLDFTAIVRATHGIRQRIPTISRCSAHCSLWGRPCHHSLPIHSSPTLRHVCLCSCMHMSYFAHGPLRRRTFPYHLLWSCPDFGLGQLCRGCGSCSECVPCP